MKITNINAFAPIWIIAGMVLCLTERLDWWVLVLIIASHIHVNIDT